MDRTPLYVSQWLQEQGDGDEDVSYKMEDPRTGVHFSPGQICCRSPPHLLHLRSPHINKFNAGIKRPKSEGDHPPPSNAHFTYTRREKLRKDLHTRRVWQKDIDRMERHEAEEYTRTEGQEHEDDGKRILRSVQQ